MARYRRIPVVVEAWKLGVIAELMPAWLKEAIASGRVESWVNRHTGSHTAMITTHVENLDYIIQDEYGEISWCKHNLFELTHKEVKEDDVPI